MPGAMTLQRGAKCVGGADVDRQPRVFRSGDQVGRRDHLGKPMLDGELRNVLGHLPLLKGCRQVFQGMGTLLGPWESVHALRIAAYRGHRLCLRVQHGIEATLQHQRQQLLLLPDTLGLEDDARERSRSRGDEALEVLLIQASSSNVQPQWVGCQADKSKRRGGHDDLTKLSQSKV